jgi:hypothetical protein
VVEQRITRYGLRIRAGEHFELVNPDSDPRYKELWQDYYELTCRKGVGIEYAKREMRRRTTLIGAMLVRHNYADGMLCGTFGKHSQHLRYVADVIGRKPGIEHFYAMNMLVLPKRTLFIGDTYINYDPTAEQLAELTRLGAEEVRRFGLTPRAALLSHSNFGAEDTPTAIKMRRALEILRRARSGPRSRRRDARRHGALGRNPAPGLPQLDPDGAGQPADHADPGCRQHRLQPAQDLGRRWPHRRPDAARRGAPGAYPDADGDGAAHRQCHGTVVS